MTHKTEKPEGCICEFHFHKGSVKRKGCMLCACEIERLGQERITNMEENS